MQSFLGKAYIIYNLLWLIKTVLFTSEPNSIIFLNISINDGEKGFITFSVKDQSPGLDPKNELQLYFNPMVT